MNHNDHHRQMIADFRKRFWLSLLLTLPVLALSTTIQGWLGFRLEFAGRPFLLLGFSTVVFIYGGWPFLKGAYEELRAGQPGMMTLIGLAIVVAFSYSAAVVLGLQGRTFFWELATLIDVMLVGHWIEMRSVLGASQALEKLNALMPAQANRLRDDGATETVEVRDLRVEDRVLVKPGERIPADGAVAEGESEVNESMLTGESRPASKGVGDAVVAGAVNGAGSLRVRITHTGSDSYLSKVVQLVQEAQEKQSRTQRLADRAAAWLTILAISAGILTLVVWLSLDRPFDFALERMVTVMVITCPHALGLAIPLVVAISTSVSARNGLLIRNRTAFENARKIDLIAFDKTGTLTTGEFGLTRWKSFGAIEDDEVLRLAAALETDSEHPLARGILAKAESRELELPSTDKFEAIKGKGVKAKIEGETYWLVSPEYLRREGIELAEAVDTDPRETTVHLLRDRQPIGVLALADEIRPESAEAVATLQSEGIAVVMLTGDQESVAAAVAKALGIDDYSAELLPDQKLEMVKKWQAARRFVAMTGDGLNDAPALAQANIGIAVGSGTDVAAETADIILVSSNPREIMRLVLFGKATFRKMVQNLFWAASYNIVTLPLAAGVLYGYGILISPAFGAILMSLSTVIVAINAQLLRAKL